MITDIEFLGLHYAETLKHWQIRFQANRIKVKDLYDEKFCRMWEYYLAASEVAFRHLDLTVFQIQMAKKREIVPITRDYLLLNGENTKKTGINDNRAA
jgi:cyclopropane-fatty-acyl-phospholipid synthase